MSVDIDEINRQVETEQSKGRAASRDLAHRALHGAVALVIRQAVVYGTNIAGGIILARLLTPSDFGFYGVILFFVVFLNIFGGTGFASNLIRTEEDASLVDYQAVFTAQQIGVGIIFASIWLMAPRLGAAYHLQHGSAFFRLVGVALMLTSLMVIPQVKMERELVFDKLAIVEAAQAVIFNLVSVILAWRGLGVLSFSIALASRAGTGAVLTNIMKPWRMGWRWDTDALRRHLRFGLALQASQLISMAKDSITPVFIGLYLGAAQMGYVTWAGALAGYPVMVLMPLQRLYMPFFARLQSDRRELGRFLSHSLWMANALTAPLAVITIALSRPLTSLVFGDKWLTALPLVYCLSIGILFSPCATPMMGALNAIGKSHLPLAMTVVYTVGTWGLGIPLILRFGILGYGFAVILVQFTALWLYWMVWKELSVSAWGSYWPSWPVAAILGLCLRTFESLHPVRSAATLIACIVSTFSIYGLILWFVFPRHTRAWVRIMRKQTHDP
jgi:O-antigen/teichoic acid export membrane protein